MMGVTREHDTETRDGGVLDCLDKRWALPYSRMASNLIMDQIRRRIFIILYQHRKPCQNTYIFGRGRGPGKIEITMGVIKSLFSARGTVQRRPET